MHISSNFSIGCWLLIEEVTLLVTHMASGEPNGGEKSSFLRRRHNPETGSTDKRGVMGALISEMARIGLAWRRRRLWAAPKRREGLSAASACWRARAALWQWRWPIARMKCRRYRGIAIGAGGARRKYSSHTVINGRHGSACVRAWRRRRRYRVADEVVMAREGCEREAHPRECQILPSWREICHGGMVLSLTSGSDYGQSAIYKLKLCRKLFLGIRKLSKLLLAWHGLLADEACAPGDEANADFCSCEGGKQLYNCRLAAGLAKRRRLNYRHSRKASCSRKVSS